MNMSPKPAVRRAIASLRISIAALAFTTGAFGQAQPKVVAKGETLKIQIYPGTMGSGHVVLWVAADKGFCEAHGVKCQLVEIPSGALGLQALASGSIDVAYATTEVAMQAAARGNDIQLVASTHPNLYISLNVATRVPMPNAAKGYPAVMADLKGKKVGVAARGAATEIQMRALLVGAGMKPEDVTFVAVGAPATAYQALQSGQVDAAMSWPPMDTVCRLTTHCRPIVELGKGQGPADLKSLNGGVQELSMSRKLIESNPVLIDAFIQSLEEATRWLKDPKNYSELLAISRKRFTLGNIPNADEGLESLLKSEIENSGVTLDRQAVKAHADYLAKYQVLDKTFDTSRFVYKNAPSPK